MRKMENQNDCVLIISHSNYLIKSGGVEKFLRDYCKVLEKKCCHYIHVFPVIEINKKFKFTGREYFVLSFDGIFEGVWKKNYLAEAVTYLAAKKSCRINNIQLHHLHGWNVQYLEGAIKKLELPIYLFIHDLEMICPSMFREGANSQCMQFVPIAGEMICSNCCYREYDVRRFNEINCFLTQIQPQIEYVYAPSSNTRNHFLRAFPQFKKKIEIRGHLLFNLKHMERRLNKNIQIAYLGSTGEHKGYKEWKKLLEYEIDKGYQFYYFGTEDIDDPRIKCVKVDARNPALKSMTMQLIDHNIDIVFLWSKCQETFCYTYYEASAAGAFVLTNKRSGNICEQVAKLKNGKIFDDISQCVTFLDDIKDVTETLQKFGDSNLIPFNIRTNDEVIGGLYKENIYTENKWKNQKNKKSQKLYKNVLLSLLYKKMRT